MARIDRGGCGSLRLGGECSNRVLRPGLLDGHFQSVAQHKRPASTWAQSIGLHPLKGGSSKYSTVGRIAEEHDATPAQVILNWLIRQSKVITIPKSSNEKHLQVNLAALGLQLSQNE